MASLEMTYACEVCGRIFGSDSRACNQHVHDEHGGWPPLLLNSTWHLTPCQAEADLAAANATIAAQRLALATMREAMIQPTLTRLDDLILPTCLVCGRIGEHRDEIIHERSCILAQPADDAAALAGAALAAADEGAQLAEWQWQEYHKDRCYSAYDSSWRCSGADCQYPRPKWLDDYLRARAALRGGGAAEG